MNVNINLLLEYAVITKKRIILFDENWTELEPTITKSGCEFMNAITYDPVHEIFYFTDRRNPDSSVFSLKVRDDKSFITTNLVPRSPSEKIEDIVYDVYDEALYWSDSGNNKIVKMIIDRSKRSKFSPKTFLNVTGRVSGLEIDSCQRNLFYTMVTDSESSINLVSLANSNHMTTSIGSDNHFMPVAIAKDHQNQRLYVADIREYNSYSIDSLLMSGKDFRTEVMKTFKTPRSLAVDVNNVYYIEATSKELRQFVKESGDNSSTLLKQLQSDPRDIIIRNNFLIDFETCRKKDQKRREIKIKSEERKEEGCESLETKM